jgi:hypothetical protein
MCFHSGTNTNVGGMSLSMREYEIEVGDALRKNYIVDYSVDPVYANKFSTVPQYFELSMTAWNQNGTYAFKATPLQVMNATFTSTNTFVDLGD